MTMGQWTRKPTLCPKMTLNKSTSIVRSVQTNDFSTRSVKAGNESENSSQVKRAVDQRPVSIVTTVEGNPESDQSWATIAREGGKRRLITANDHDKERIYLRSKQKRKEPLAGKPAPLASRR